MIIDIITESIFGEKICFIEGSIFLLEKQQSLYFNLRKQDQLDQIYLHISGERSHQQVWFPHHFRLKEYDDRTIIEWLALNAERLSEAVN